MNLALIPAKILNDNYKIIGENLRETQMSKVFAISNIVECRRVWKQVMPQEEITDLWEFRECFHKNYQRPLNFIVSEKEGQIKGLLPLSWMEETGSYGYFPGETWNEKTWLERNRIVSSSVEDLERLFDKLKEGGKGYYLRYLLNSPQRGLETVDEINYRFLPKDFDFNIDNYFKTLSNKLLKNLRKERAALVFNGIDFRFNVMGDFNTMVKWNLKKFGSSSYFADSRFLNSFKDLMPFLDKNKWLRLTTLLLWGEPAAIDFGCVFNNKYTLLAGGVNDKFPGVAKMINLYHMSKACEEKYDEVDFLCGDFSWKERFNLTKNPLFKLSNTDSSL